MVFRLRLPVVPLRRIGKKSPLLSPSAPPPWGTISLSGTVSVSFSLSFSLTISITPPFVARFRTTFFPFPPKLKARPSLLRRPPGGGQAICTEIGTRTRKYFSPFPLAPARESGYTGSIERGWESSRSFPAGRVCRQKFDFVRRKQYESRSLRRRHHGQRYRSGLC